MSVSLSLSLSLSLSVCLSLSLVVSPDTETDTHALTAQGTMVPMSQRFSHPEHTPSWIGPAPSGQQIDKHTSHLTFSHPEHSLMNRTHSVWTTYIHTSHLTFSHSKHTPSWTGPAPSGQQTTYIYLTSNVQPPGAHSIVEMACSV